MYQKINLTTFSVLTIFTQLRMETIDKRHGLGAMSKYEQFILLNLLPTNNLIKMQSSKRFNCINCNYIDDLLMILNF